jgi:hypothetical protein
LPLGFRCLAAVAWGALAALLASLVRVELSERSLAASSHDLPSAGFWED